MGFASEDERRRTGNLDRSQTRQQRVQMGKLEGQIRCGFCLRAFVGEPISRDRKVRIRCQLFSQTSLQCWKFLDVRSWSWVEAAVSC